MTNPDDLVKFRGGVFIPKPKKKERGNPNYYFAPPQKGDPTEIDIGEHHCWNCKKKMPCIKMWIADPIQYEDVGLKGEKIEPNWLNVCKKCKYPIDKGVFMSHDFASAQQGEQ